MVLLKKAAAATIPVMAGYLVLGAGFGIMMHDAGFGVLFSSAMSLFLYAGSMQYAGVSLIAGGASVLTTALMTLLINARHLFYAVSMSGRYEKAGWKKPYLVFALTDETYSLVCDGRYPEGTDRYAYWFTVSMLNQLYWVAGTAAGALAAGAFSFNSTGIDFAMTALFVATFTEQWLCAENHLPALCGLFITLGCRLVFGTDLFLIPSMILISAVLLVLKRRIAHHEL